MLLAFHFQHELSWVNFINVLQATFMREDPKSTKKTNNLTVFWGFWDLLAKKLLLELC
jgi:hypothetical protein